MEEQLCAKYGKNYAQDQAMEVDVGVDGFDSLDKSPLSFMDIPHIKNNFELIDSDEEDSVEEPFSNPFFVPFNSSTNTFKKTKDLVAISETLYFMVLKDDADTSKKNLRRLSVLNNPNAVLDDLKTIADLVTLIKVPFSMVNFSNIRHGLILINDSKYLTAFNNCCDVIPDKSYVYMILNSTKSVVTEWVETYFRKDSLDQFIRQKIFTDYNNFADHSTEKKSIDCLSNISDFSYWENPGNCATSITKKWSDRQINLSLKWDIPVSEINSIVESIEKAQQTTKTIQKKVEKPTIQKKKTDGGSYPHIPIASVEQTTEKKRMENAKLLGITSHIDAKSSDSNSYFVPSKSEDQSLDRELVRELLMTNSLTTKESLFLLTNLIVSKNYSHYVLNDIEVMNKYKSLMSDFAPLFRYAMGYAMCTYYKEESYKRTTSNVTDRHILDIRVASQFPIYPYDSHNPRMNPYYQVYVSEDVLNLSSNLGGVEFPLDKQKGIVNLDEFKRRLNTFISGDPEKDYLKGIDWSNMVITGGSMSAIIPTSNPLNKGNITEFFNNYYGSSDIDIACNFNNFFDFIEHVKSIKKTLSVNSGIKEAKIKTVSVNTACIYVDFNILRQKCKSKEIPFDIKYLIDNKNKLEVKEFFYELYQENKRILNLRNKQKLGKRINETEYYSVLRTPSIDEFTVIIREDVRSIDIGKRVSEAQTGSGLEFTAAQNADMKFIPQDSSEPIFFFTVDNIRFKLLSPSLLHSFEIFRIDYDSFFSCVSRFHFPCVRAYYDGTTCYMSTSALMAYMTLVNNEYKYFSGSCDPITILKKYRERGYGTFLNKSEINQYIATEIIDETRKELLGIKNLEDYPKILGCLPPTHAFFTKVKSKASAVEEEGPINTTGKKARPAPKALPKVTEALTSKTLFNIVDYYNANYPQFDTFFNKITTVNPDGNIAPFKRWVIDAAYDALIGNAKKID